MTSTPNGSSVKRTPQSTTAMRPAGLDGQAVHAHLAEAAERHDVDRGCHRGHLTALLRAP